MEQIKSIQQEAEILDPEVVSSDLTTLELETITKKQINILKSDFLFLTVKNYDDLDSYKKCDKARKQVKQYRTKIDKKRKEIKKALNQRKTDLDKFADDMINDLKKIESHLQKQQNVVDDHKKAQEEAAIDARMDDLSVFTGMDILSRQIIAKMSDEEFNNYRNQVSKAHYAKVQEESKAKVEEVKIDIVPKENPTTKVKELSEPEKAINDVTVPVKADSYKTITIDIDIDNFKIRNALKAISVDVTRINFNPLYGLKMDVLVFPDGNLKVSRFFKS